MQALGLLSGTVYFSAFARECASCMHGDSIQKRKEVLCPKKKKKHLLVAAGVGNVEF